MMHAPLRHNGLVISQEEEARLGQRHGLLEVLVFPCAVDEHGIKFPARCKVWPLLEDGVGEHERVYR